MGAEVAEIEVVLPAQGGFSPLEGCRGSPFTLAKELFAALRLCVILPAVADRRCRHLLSSLRKDILPKRRQAAAAGCRVRRRGRATIGTCSPSSNLAPESGKFAVLVRTGWLPRVTTCWIRWFSSFCSDAARHAPRDVLQILQREFAVRLCCPVIRRLPDVLHDTLLFDEVLPLISRPPYHTFVGRPELALERRDLPAHRGDGGLTAG